MRRWSFRSIAYAAVFTIIVALIVWRLVMPLPSPTWIQQHFPLSPDRVRFPAAPRAPLPTTPIQVSGVYNASWAAVAAYHTDDAMGYGVMEKGLRWWRPVSDVWAPIPTARADARVTYRLDTVWRVISLWQRRGGREPRLVWGQLLTGRANDAAVRSVEVRWDDGTTRSAAVEDGFFAMWGQDQGAACSLELLDVAGRRLETLVLPPPTLLSVESQRVDCTS